MQDLTPVRLAGGGRLLVLADADGREYVVPVDERFRETLGQALSDQATRETPAPAPLGIRTKEPTMESTLRPRDIQARIRAGESAEDVAAVAGTSVDRVMIFAAPVLAERAHVAQGALTSSVRRKSPEPTSTVRTLGAAAAAKLREEGVDPDGVEWDAWRRDDGRWTLVAGYHHDGERRCATFELDQPGRFVTAQDDEGRWLVGDGSFPTRAQKAEAARLHLAPVPRYDEVLPLGDDAIELVREDDRAPAPHRPHVPVAVPEPDAVTGDADWIAPERPAASSGSAAVIPDSAPRPEQLGLGDPEMLPGIDPASPVEPADGPSAAEEGGLRADPHADEAEPDELPAVSTPRPLRPARQDHDGDHDADPHRDQDPLAASPTPDDVPADEAQPEKRPEEPKRVSRKARGRASVPSWDEIMFGGGRGD